MPDLSLTAVALLLFGALYTDILSGIIPNRMTFGFAVAGLIIQAVVGWPHVFTTTGIWATGLATGGLLLLIPYVHRAAGGGDLKLFAAIGAIIGPWQVCQIFLFSCAAWGVFSLLILARVPLIRNMGVALSPRADLRSTAALPFSVPAAAGFMVFACTGGI